MEKNYYLKIELSKANEIFVKFKLPEQYEVNSDDWIGLFLSEESNHAYITYEYNSNKAKEGRIQLPTQPPAMNRNLYQVRYLPNDQYKSILVSEVFEIPILHKPKLTANLKNPKKVIVQWEFPDAYQPNYYDWIGLFFKDEANINFLSWKYNTNTTRKGKLEFPLFHFQTNEEREFVFRYLPNNKYQEIGESEPFKLKYEIKNIELSIPKQEFEYGESVTVEWNFPKEFPVSSKDWIGLYYSTSNSKQYITYQYNSSSTRKGKATFDFSLFKNTDILNTFQMRYLPQDSYFLQFSSKPFRFKFLQKSGIEIPTKNPQFGSPLYFQIKLPEDYTPNISDSFAIFFNESIDQNTNQEPDPLLEIRNTQLSRFGILNFQLDFDLQKKIDELGNQNQSNLFVIKYISHSSLNEKKILLVSSPFKIDNIQNIKLTVSKKQISFGESIDVGWELPGYYHPNYYDWIGLYVKGTPNNSYLTYQYNSFESIKGKMTFDIGNFITDQDQIFEFRYLPNDKYISIAESEEIKVKSKFKKQTKLTVSKKQISFGESIDVEWELPKNYKPNYHDWIGLYVKGTPNNSYLTYQYNNDTSIKGKMTFDIGNFITDQDQIFEFRYLPKDRYLSIAESEEIKVKSEFKKQTKLTVSKNQISFGESIDVEWELPDYYHPNYHDWIGLYVKGTPNNSYLTYQYNSSSTINGKMTFSIWNYIKDQDQIFEFRYLPNDRYLSIAESEGIQVRQIEGGEINTSSFESKIGDRITISWQLPNDYEPQKNDQLIFFRKQFQSKDQEMPKNFQFICYNEKCERKGEAEFIIKSGGGMIAEEFAIGYTFSYSFVICQSPIIVQPSDFIGIKILNKRINFGDKIQVLWSLPSFFNPSENDSIAFFSPKISKAIYDKESFENNSQALYSGFVELKPNFAQKYNQNEIFAVGYFGYYDFFPIYRSEPFEIQLKNVGKNLQVDLLNLFLRQEFCDLTINYLDGNIRVHQLILLMRFDNDQSILTRIQEMLSTKPAKQVIPFLIFIYSGMIDPNISLDLDLFKKDDWNLIERNHPLFSFYWKVNEFDFDAFNSQEFLSQFLRDDDNFIHLQNEQNLLNVFQELGFDKNWIDNKKEEAGIQNDLLNLYSEKITKKDFGIICNDSSEIKVHKLILITRSNLFRGMFLNVQDDSNTVRDYSGKSKETLEQLIHYFYFGEFDLDSIQNPEKLIQEYEDIEDFYQLSEFNPMNNRLKEIERNKN